MTIKKSNSFIFTFGMACILLLSACVSQPSDDNTAQTHETPLIAAESFFSESSISHVRVSGDGKWLAFLKEHNGANNIHIMKADASIDTAFFVTKFKDPINNFQWSVGENDLFFTKDIGGNEKTQIFMLSLSEFEGKTSHTMEKLTTNEQASYRLMKQSTLEPNKLIVMANQDDAARVDIFHLDTNMKTAKRVYKNTLGFSNVGYNGDGNPVLGRSTNPDNSTVLYAILDGNWRKVIHTQPGEKLDILSVDDKNNVAYISGNFDGRDKKALLRLDMTSSKFTTLHKDPKGESDIEDVLFSDKGAPISVSYYGGRLRTYPLNKTFAQHWKQINKHFERDVEIRIVTRNEKTALWQLSVASDKDIERAYQYNADTGHVEELLEQKATINLKFLADRQSIHYQARDGVTIQAYLTLPKGDVTKLPTIILPHGGPWARDYWTLNSGYFNPVAQLLANRGYAVLQPNFRSSTGFGKRFLNLGDKNWGTGAMQNDLTDGVNYLVKKGIADKDRVGIMGGSYGGYAALSGAVFTPSVYHAAISYCGPSSLITLMESFPSYYRPYLGQWYGAVGDPEIENDRIDMNKRSPINFVDNIDIPLMLIQGANDPRVTQVESDNIATLMHKKSLPVEYVLAEDEGHGFQKRNNKLAFIIAMERFFSKHLGGKISNNVSPELETHLANLMVDLSEIKDKY